MADQFQYIKLPDGSYGKFSPDASDETVRGAIEKDFPEAFAPKLEAPVPAGLAGPKDPEYKPFLSGSNLLDEGTGVLKSGAKTVAMAGKALSHVPVIGKPVMDPQKIQDMENYSDSANKGELFGKVLGTVAQAIPAIYGGGEFAGGVLDEVGPALLAPTGRALGRVAMPAAKELGKHLLKGAGAGASLYGLEKLRELF